MDNTKIIVVEDNIVYCEFVCNLLAREGFRTVQAFHLSTAKTYLQQAANGAIVVSDLRLPDGNGIDLLRWMRKEGRMQPFVIMTDYAEVHTAVESMKLGSLDYIPKQLVEDKLVPLLRTILKERHTGRNRMPLFSRDGSAFQAIMKRIRLVAPTDMSVLIFGENGTGKEHIAHLLHDKGKRAGKPFVAVDCGSLTKELAPSAFFGHVRGAFTGADSAKKGYFHEAEGGTLFWTRWATSHRKPSRCYSAPYRNVGSVPLATSLTVVSMSALSPPPTRIWKRRSVKSVSGRTCYTACMTSR